MIQLKKITSPNKDLIDLIKELDAYLKITDQDDHDFYNQYNGLEEIKNFILVYDEEKAIGCGAFKEYDSHSIEIKRMYVKPSHRGSGIADSILKELENWANQLGYKRSILETGVRQKAALHFYDKSGYQLIPNYGQYAAMEESRCFEKNL